MWYKVRVDIEGNRRNTIPWWSVGNLALSFPHICPWSCFWASWVFCLIKKYVLTLRGNLMLQHVQGGILIPKEWRRDTLENTRGITELVRWQDMEESSIAWVEQRSRGCWSCKSWLGPRKGLTRQTEGLECYFLSTGEPLNISEPRNAKARARLRQ